MFSFNFAFLVTMIGTYIVFYCLHLHGIDKIENVGLDKVVPGFKKEFIMNITVNRRRVKKKALRMGLW